MEVLLVVVGERLGRKLSPLRSLVDEYVLRCGRFGRVATKVFATEALLLEYLERSAQRTRPVLWVADSGGELLSSPELAAELGRRRDGGTQMLVVAIGPADGWSAAARARAELVVSFGRITLPHELAAVVAAEQVYRALTILAGHPYHSGH